MTSGSGSSAIRTFLIADVRGYTRFTSERGDEAAARLATKFADLANDVVAGCGGTVVELRGDEALAVFDSARNAIRSAVELQRRFVNETVADPSLPLPVGIGLDAGEAVAVGEGYRGGALNLAARLCSLAGPAEILATREVVHLARRVEGVAYDERGTVRVKGVAEEIAIVRLRAEAGDAAEDIAFRRALGASGAALAPAVPDELARNPYKGLRAFEEPDAADFFGREELVEQLVTRLADTRFLAVLGPSGSGKSSVVRAGLIPALRRGALPGSNEWTIVDIVPGAHPIEELEAALLRAAVNPPSSLSEQLLRDERGLASAVKRVLPADSSELLLVIDQFEEVFTLVASEEARTHLLNSIEAAVTDERGRLRVVVTLRADFYDRPLLYRGFAELLRSRVEVVVPLSPEQLERTIAGPAQRAGVRLEPGLVAHMLGDVADQPGALPLLEYALTELFERRDQNLLTLQAYREIGGISGALSRRAEELYGAMDEPSKSAARQLFLRLVTLGEGVEDTRRPVPRSELASLDIDQAAMAKVIDAFGASRLVSFDRDSRSGEPNVEVAHEALLGAWERLRRWIDDARDDLRHERRLAAAARDWVEAGRDPSFLASGSRLAQFETWRQGTGISMTPDEREFLDASLAERDRIREEEEAREARERDLERRSVRRLRALVAVLTATAIVAAALTVFAFGQRGRADRERRIATARELAVASVASLDVDPERAILLALEAVRATRSSDGVVLPEAREALHRAVVASRVTLTVPNLGGNVSWSPRGVFVTEGPEESGLIDIRDAKTGKQVLQFKGHDVDVNSVVFSPDGSRLATTGDDSKAKLWDPATGKLLWELPGPTSFSPVFGASFSSDGSLFAAVWIGQRDIVRVVDVRSGRILKTLDSLPAPGQTSFSPDGSRLAVSVNDPPGAFVVDTATGATILRMEGHPEPVTDVDWSPDGKWIVTSGADTVPLVRDASTGRVRFRLGEHSAGINNTDWSRDSKRLVTGSADGTVRVWELSGADAREIETLHAHELAGGVFVAFSPDGTRVIGGGYGIQGVKIWDLGRGGDAEWVNLPADPGFPAGTAFASDGRAAATWSGNTVTLWDAESGSLVRRMAVPDKPGRQETGFIEVSPDGKYVASAGNPLVPTVWDAQTGAVAFEIVNASGDLAWSPDSSRLAAISEPDGRVEVLDRSGKLVAALKEAVGHTAGRVAFAPDGRRVLTARRPSDRPDPTAFKVEVWDWRKGTIERTIDAPAGGLAIDPTGRLIATGSPLDGTGAVWDAATGERVATLSGHVGAITDVAFAPDGSSIATASDDGTVRLWDPRSGVQKLVLRGHANRVIAVAFTPDGSKLASSAAGEVRVWALDLDDLITIARRNVTRTLTAAECSQYLHRPCPRR